MNNKVKLSAIAILLLSVCFTYGETRNIVPRGPSEGSIGTSQKPWGDGWFDDLHVGGNSIFSNLEGTNGVAITPTETGAAVGLDTNALTSLPKFLKWDGEKIVWDDKFDIPEGMDVPAYLASLNVPNFMQQQSVEVPGVVASIYENNPGEELVSEVNFGTRELGRFDLEEITGPTQFIVTETNGYYGKFNSSVEYTKVRPGVCIVINGQYYPIADITDGDGWGQGNGSVKLSLPLVPGETYDVEGYSGILPFPESLKLSYSYVPEPSTVPDTFKVDKSSVYPRGWCCTPDFKIQYMLAGYFLFKSVDSGETWEPVLREPGYLYDYDSHMYANMACSPDGETVLVNVMRYYVYQHEFANYDNFTYYTTNSFETFERIFEGYSLRDCAFAGSNSFGSTTWVLAGNDNLFVSTNNMTDWLNCKMWLNGKTQCKTAIVDPDLNVCVFHAGNNVHEWYKGNIQNKSPTTALANFTVYNIPYDTPNLNSQWVQPLKIRFLNHGTAEIPEIDTNIVMFLNGYWQNDHMFNPSSVHFINKENNAEYSFFDFSPNITAFQILENDQIATLSIGTPIKAHKAKVIYEDNAFKLEDHSTIDIGPSVGVNAFAIIDRDNSDYWVFYNTLKINAIDPSIWFRTYPYFYSKYGYYSTDYGKSWKTFFEENPVNDWQQSVFPLAANGDKFIYAYPTPHIGNDKRLNYKFRSLQKADISGNNGNTIDGDSFLFYSLAWPVTNKLYALTMICGYNRNDNSFDRLAVSEDEGKTFYFPGGPSHALLGSIYVQSMQDDSGEIVTNVAACQYQNRSSRPWVWNSKDEKWISLNNPYYFFAEWNEQKVLRFYPDGSWAGKVGRGNYDGPFIYKVVNARSKYINTAFWRNAEPYYDRNPDNSYEDFCIVDDPDTGEEIWYHGDRHYTIPSGQENSGSARIMASNPNIGNMFRILPGSPTGRCDTIEAVSKDVIWCSITTNQDQRWNVWKTTDGGETFENMTSGKTVFGNGNTSYSTTKYAIWPVDENVCWIALGSYFYETTDGGETWERVGSAPNNTRVNMISGDHANRANTNAIWYVTYSGRETENTPQLYITTNQFRTSEPFGWNPYAEGPFGTHYIYRRFLGLYVPQSNPDVIYSGIVGDYPVVSKDGGKTWQYIADPDDPENIPNQFAVLPGAGADPNYGWQVSGYGDTVIYTKVYKPFDCTVNNVKDVRCDVYISTEQELPDRFRKFKRLDLPDKFYSGNCPLTVGGCAYAGFSIIMNQGLTLCYYSDEDGANYAGIQTAIIKTNGIDSASWAQLEEVAVDSLYSKPTKSAVSVLFSFDQGNSYKKYDKLAQAWETVVYKDVDTGTWYFRTERNPGRQDQYGTVPAQSPQASISAAMAYKFNRFSDEEISQVTDLEWNYPGAFDSETTSNMMFSVTFIPAEEYNGKAEVPAIYNVSFKTVMKSDLYTKKDNNYLVTQQEGETSSTVTKTNSAVANSVIYYLRNIP